jgi:hypothetical protein
LHRPPLRSVTGMNRFDPEFNDTDPVTHRPFSGGHPDGVWIIAIVLGIPVVIAALGDLAAVLMLFFAKSFLAAMLNLIIPLVATAVIALLFVPPTSLMFRRSRHSLNWMLGLVGLTAVVAIAATSMPDGTPMKAPLQVSGLIGSVVFASFAYYLFRLKREELLH